MHSPLFQYINPNSAKVHISHVSLKIYALFILFTQNIPFSSKQNRKAKYKFRSLILHPCHVFFSTFSLHSSLQSPVPVLPSRCHPPFSPRCIFSISDNHSHPQKFYQYNDPTPDFVVPTKHLNSLNDYIGILYFPASFEFQDMPNTIHIVNLLAFA